MKHSPNVAIAPEAEDRIRGHDVVLEYVESVAVETASDLHVPIRRLIVAPARSHEYDDRTGIVVKIDIEVDGERRFVLWEAICEKLDEQKDRLNSEERRFLDDDVSVVVGGY